MGILSSISGLFGGNKAEAAEKEAHFATAQLNHLIMPIDRGDRYEDPLDDALREAGLGFTDGGGTMQQKSGEIEYIDVEIALHDLEKGIPFVIEHLEKWGAPKGSVLKIYENDSRREIPFGKTEGVAVYLDGVNLPDEVYAESDVNVVIEEIDKALGGAGEFQSHWQGNEETALYFYGVEASKMKELMKPFLASYPLCKGARVVIIAPKTETKD